MDPSVFMNFFNPMNWMGMMGGQGQGFDMSQFFNQLGQGVATGGGGAPTPGMDPNATGTGWGNYFQPMQGGGMQQDTSQFMHRLMPQQYGHKDQDSMGLNSTQLQQIQNMFQQQQRPMTGGGAGGGITTPPNGAAGWGNYGG